MSISIKLDQQTSRELRSILASLNIHRSRIVIDLNKDTVEVEEEHNIDDLLQWAGILTPDQGKELLENVKKNRNEDWD